MDHSLDNPSDQILFLKKTGYIVRGQGISDLQHSNVSVFLQFCSDNVLVEFCWDNVLVDL